MVDHLLSGLRTIRTHRRLKASEMAECIGVAPTSYTRFERGERRIYWDKAIMLANRLGVRADDLIHPLSEDAAARLCDERDKAAIAAGTFYPSRWTTVKDDRIVIASPPAATVPPPPPVSTVPPPPSDPDALPQELQDWIDG